MTDRQSVYSMSGPLMQGYIECLLATGCFGDLQRQPFSPIVSEQMARTLCSLPNEEFRPEFFI